MSNHIFENAAPQASQPFTSLEAIGIGPGWQCWEVGAGGGRSWCGLESAALAHAQLEIQLHDIGVAMAATIEEQTIEGKYRQAYEEVFQESKEPLKQNS
jgi:hypothetical protein